jgi:two-component SAPR family response regulator
MDQMTGFELFQKIRDKDEKVKVCFITAFEEYHKRFQETFPNLEVDCFIRKPILSYELVKIIKAKLNC